MIEGNPPARNMFFILGRGRSGTWLLQSILDNHPRLSVAPEALFIMSLYYRYRKVNHWNKQLLETFARDLWTENRLKDWWKLTFEELRQHVLKYEGRYTYADLCAAVYRLYADKHGKPPDCPTGDKNPSYALFIPELLSLYPKAKFICMVRDYRDNILSFKKVDFDLNNTAGLAYRWKSYNAQIWFYAQTHPGQFLLKRFEDLMEHPQKTLEDICRFLGVDFDERMLQFYKGKDRESLESWQYNLDKPLVKSVAQKWKKHMPPEDVAIAEWICGPTGKRFGYETTWPPPSFLLKLKHMPGLVSGMAANFLEKHFFKIPFRLRTALLRIYRKQTRTMR